MTPLKSLMVAMLALGTIDLVAVNLWIWPRGANGDGAQVLSAGKVAPPVVAVRPTTNAEVASARGGAPATRPAQHAAASPADRAAPSATAQAAKVPAKSLPAHPSKKLHAPMRILFATASAELSARARQSLDEVAAAANPGDRIAIAGYADPRGEKRDNIKLGARRAAAVAAYLRGHGVAADHIDTTSFGEQRSIAGGRTAEARRLSRRVEVTFREGRSP